MEHKPRTRQELLNELERLQRRITQLEAEQETSARHQEELQRQRDKASAHARIIGAILNTFDLEERLRVILDEVLNLLDMKSGGIYLVSGDDLVLRTSKGLSSRLRSQLLSFPISNAPNWARRSYVWDAGSENDAGLPTSARSEQITVWASVPLELPKTQDHIEKEWIGTLFVADRRLNILTEDDMAVMTAMADQLALAIDHARAYQQARRRLVRLEALRDIDRAIIRRLELNEILQVLLERVPVNLGADAVAVTLLDGPGDRPYVFVMRLPNGTIVEQEAFTLAENLLHWFVERQEAVIIYNLQEDPRIQMHRSRIRQNRLSSYLGVPLVVHENTMGILHILSREPRVFGEEEVEFFKTMAGQAAIAIANARLLDTTRRQAEKLTEQLRNLKHAERELQKSHARLAQAQRLAQLGSWEWDITANELHWSDEIYRIFHISREDFKGTHEAFLELVHPADRERVKSAVEQSWKEQNPYDIDHRVVWPDGSIRVVHERAQVIFDEHGEPVRMIGTVQDMTELRHLEKSLRESEEQFRSLVEFCPVGIMIIQDGRIVYQNPEQERILGLPLGSSAFECLLGLIHEEDREEIIRLFDRVFRSGKHSAEAEARFYRQHDGYDERRTLWCHCRMNSMSYEGRPALLLIMMEITQKKEMEQLVVAQEKMASLGQIAAGIAHEIRNPLSGINVFLDAIKENLGETDTMEEITELVDEARNAARKIENVIRRVLDFSRYSAPRMHHANLNDPVRSAVELARNTLKKSGVQLDSHYAPNLPAVYLDEQLIEQVVLNLITNAVDAAGDAEGPKRVTVSSYAERDWVGFRVTDTGPGVPVEDREKIFEPFYTRKKEGTGIGLSLCRRIVADHRGSIELGRSPAGETVVDVRLPLKKRLEPR